jgi:hypothetical protein
VNRSDAVHLGEIVEQQEDRLLHLRLIDEDFSVALAGA